MKLYESEDDLENIYELSNEDFFKTCLKEYNKRDLISDYETFCEDQLEHMELLAEKYQNAVRENQKLPITKDNFIRLKKYKKYFKQLTDNPIKTFDELFEEAIKFNRIETPINSTHKESLRSFHGLNFNLWLQKNKNWEIEDEFNYRRLLTPENFNTYLKDDRLETLLAQLKLKAQDDQRRMDWADKDQRYWVDDSMKSIKESNHDYKSLQNQISDSGAINAKNGNDTVKIYTPELVFIFFYDFPARNMDTEEETTLRKSEYFDSYIAAFKDGFQFFKDEFHISNDILYAPGSSFVANLHFQYYHLENDDTLEGWQFVRKRYPAIVTHKEIKKFGFYSGIVSALYELMDKHPIPFKKFTEPCDLGDSENELVMPTENIKGDKTSEMTPEADDNYFVLKNTVDEYLEPFKEAFQDVSSYEMAINSLTSFFYSNPTLPPKPIFLKSGTKTRIAKELGKLYQMTVEKPITKEYLVFLKGLFSPFSNEDLDSNLLQFTNMYKYCTTKKKQ